MLNPGGRTWLAGLVVSLAAAGTSLVAAGTLQAQEDPEGVAQAEAAVAEGLPSPKTATLISTLSTVAPLVVGYAAGESDDVAGVIGGLGVLFGPAAGYFYGGATGRGFKGVGIRAGITLVTAAGMAAVCGDSCSWEDGEAIAILLLGGGALWWSMIHDVVSVDNHVRAANERKRAAQVSLGPAMIPGIRKPGLVLRVSH